MTTKLKPAKKRPRKIGGVHGGKKGGEAPAYNARVHRIIVREMKSAFQDKAAEAAGIDERTLERWLAKGRKEPGGQYGQLVRDVEASRIVREDALVQKIQRAKDWRAAAWMLPKINRERFGDHAHLVVEYIETKLEALIAATKASVDELLTDGAVCDGLLREKLVTSILGRLDVAGGPATPRRDESGAHDGAGT